MNRSEENGPKKYWKGSAPRFAKEKKGGGEKRVYRLLGVYYVQEGIWPKVSDNTGEEATKQRGKTKGQLFYIEENPNQPDSERRKCCIGVR